MKKKSILRSVLTAVLTLVATAASAHDFEVDGIYYNKNGDGTVSVTYKGSSYYQYADEYTGDVVIPTSFTYSGTTYSVTSIGSEAFEDCSGLKSVTIGNSVTSIGNSAFYKCSGLTSVTIPNSVITIDAYAFSFCGGLKRITIPKSVTYIGGDAFYACDNLTYIIVDSENQTYDSRNNCNAIIETATNTLLAGCWNTTIPNSVTSIGHSAFGGCSDLRSVTIPYSVSSIGESAFWYCGRLEVVTIPNSVTSIGKSAFRGCSSLTIVDISSLEAWLGIKFTDTLSNPLYYARHLFLNGEEVKDLVIPNSVTSIGNYAFQGYSGLTSVSIPNSVTSIGESAFYGCSALKKAIVKAITPPRIESQSFNNYDLKLIVPAISKEEYKSANYWSLFTNYADAEIMITALRLEKDNASIKSSETIQLTANVTPIDATFADVLLWTSSNEDVATVDGNGVVAAISDGTATITASTVDGGTLTAACVVSVGAGAVEGVDTAAARIYTAAGCIIIAATEDGEAAVYDFTGRLIKSVPVVAGDSTAVPVMPGCYIVRTGATTQSVVVK